MRERISRRGLSLIVGMAGLLCPAVWATPPAMSTLSGSSVSILGSQRSIVLQSIPLYPSSTAGSFRTGDTLDLPRMTFAFGQYLDLYQNQEATGVLDPVTGASTISVRVWLQDSRGNRLELPVMLTTGVPSGTDCTHHALCFGGPGDLPHCQGTAWSVSTGDVKYVTTMVVPTGSGTMVDCEVLTIILRARIMPGDADGDGIQDAIDKCPATANPTQTDSDGDGIGNACDNCAGIGNPYQGDPDGDGIGNACEPLNVNFQPASSPVPPGYLKDSGLPFDPARGYGWLGSTTLQTRDRNVLADQRFDTFAFSTSERVWEATLPGGTFDVSLAIGDPSFPQGPQRVVGEEVMVFDGVMTAASQNLEATVARQLVADGRLDVKIGGAGGVTALNYVTAVESPAQPFHSRFINFQPASSPVPFGFEADAGTPYSAATGHGWDGPTPVPAYDRTSLGNPVLDTFVTSGGELRTWQLVVPPDIYQVQIGVGDAAYAQGPETVIVEGTTWLSGRMTQAGEMLTLSGRVQVLDGFLTVGIGETGSVTPLDYTSLASLTRDVDGDGASNFTDNCLDVPNSGQQDADGNGVGDACNGSEDADGDEWADSLDNCPTVNNPTQADSDGNGIGNACNSSEDSDGDEWAQSLDNCPFLSNPDQADGDGDDFGDVCDCAPGEASSHAPVAEVQGLKVAGGSSSLITWDAQTALAGSGTVYDVVTETLASLRDAAPFQQSECLANNLTAATIADPRMPAQGAGYLYLVRAQNACGTGTYGSGTGVPDPRTALESGPCP